LQKIDLYSYFHKNISKREKEEGESTMYMRLWIMRTGGGKVEVGGQYKKRREISFIPNEKRERE